MELVLGLSITSTAVRWVLVAETTGEGTTIDRGAYDLDDTMASHDTEGVVDVVLGDAIAAAGDSTIYAIGVTWTNEMEDWASVVLQSLADKALENVIAVSDVEAADALATGIAAIAGYDELAVCIVEADAAVHAVLHQQDVTVERIDRTLDGTDVADLATTAIAMSYPGDRRPDVIFVLGSADDLDLIVAAIDAETETPVISAAEANLALARGAALASAQAVNALDTRVAPTGRRWPSRVGALTSVVVAASLTLVVSLSVALGARLVPDSERSQLVNASDRAAGMASEPSVTTAAPPRPPAAPVVAKTIAAVAPPAPAAAQAPPPAYVPPAPAYAPPAPAYVPPAPAYVPPAPAPAYAPPAPPPNYVPPVQQQPQQPRLRDRIIERIPIINRFHEPEYPYN